LSQTARQIVIPLAPSTGTVGNFGYLSGDYNHGRYWNTAFLTQGPASIARDNGFSGTIGLGIAKNVDLQVSYNRSVRYAQDQVVFSLLFNANGVFRKLTNY